MKKKPAVNPAHLIDVPVVNLNELLKKKDRRVKVGESEARITQPAVLDMLRLATQARQDCWGPVPAKQPRKKGKR